MRKAILLLLFVLIILPSNSQSIDKRLKGIEKEMEKVLETFKAAGFGVAVVEKDKIIYSKGFGYSNYEEKIPADENTLFAIGSCTKAFTTTIMGMMESDGDISIDEHPSEYIPGFTFINDELNNSIKIKDMMSHRTGLPRHDFSWYFFPGSTKDALLKRVKYMEPFTGVREQWYYNNFMFLAQGIIAEKVSNKSWEQNVKERIFSPLEMSRSNLSIDELEASDNIARGYELKDNSEIKKMDYYRIASMSPAGSINSSVKEMSNWLITWINGGKFKDKEIIPFGFHQLAISSQMVVAAGLPSKEGPDMHFTNYGFGWFLTSYKGHYRVEHGGNIDGFSASTCFFPSDSIGIVVLANQNGSVVPGVVRNLIADRILDVNKSDWIKIQKERLDKAIEAAAEAKFASSSAQKIGTSISHDLEDFTGRYSNDGYGELEIKMSGDSLYAELPLVMFYLDHYHYDVFEPYSVEGSKVDTTNAMGMKIKFETNNSGEISGLESKFEPALDPIFFKKVAVEVAMETEVLESFCGEYELMGATVKVYLKGDNKLFLFVPGQPEYELISIGDNKFNLKVVEGYSVEFVNDDNKNVTDLKFIQPNGIFTAKRK